MAIVDILLLGYRQVEFESMQAIEAMVVETQRHVHSVKLNHCRGSSLIDAARNRAFGGVRPEADWILLLDDDMLPQPDSLLRLMALNAPVASAVYTSRTFPIRINLRLYDRETDTWKPPKSVPENQILEGLYAAGAGFLLLKQSALNQVREFHLSAEDWRLEHAGLFSRLHVNRGAIADEQARLSKQRRAKYQVDPTSPRLFDRHIDDKTEIVYGEDFSFFLKLFQCGLSTVIDTGLMIGHIGTFPYHLSMVGLDRASEVVFPEEVCA